MKQNLANGVSSDDRKRWLALEGDVQKFLKLENMTQRHKRNINTLCKICAFFIFFSFILFFINEYTKSVLSFSVFR